MTLKEEQGNLIKALREKQGFTQEELAYRASVSIDAIRQLERGAKLARLDTLFKIAKGLDCHPDDLYLPLWEYWKSHNS